MKSTFSFLSLLLLVLIFTQISYAKTPTLEELRSLGPAGLKILMDQYHEEIRRHIEYPSATSDAQWQRIETALDTVAQQKNSYISGLYWYTDLEEAKKASAAANKPILSLRLLGNLTDEFSCANSRFFRTVLYANANVSDYLRENYVLHWQSVRPVPKVTIDYGDGRKLERTLTGNSIHYVLDSQARPIEAFPGLYGPQAFLRALVDAKGLYKLAGGQEAKNFMLMMIYQDRHNKTAARWFKDTQQIGGKAPEGFKLVSTGNGDALSIAPLAVTKMITETTILQGMTKATEGLASITDETAWRKIAALHASDAVLDEQSIGLIKRQNPSLTKEEMTRLLRKFQELIALDTVRNEYLMHSELYKFLMRDPDRNDVQRLNEKVYASLFRTPRSDEWLGLFSADVYTALDNGGVVKP